MSNYKFSILRDYEIQPSGRAAPDVVNDIKGALTGAWDFWKSAKAPGAKKPTHFFTYDPSGGPKRHLCLSEQATGELKVVNVVPDKSAPTNSLTQAEYNEAIEEFDTTFVQPRNLSTTTTKGTVTMSHWLSKETIEKLERFSNGANKGDCGTHPLDRERWYDAIIAAYENSDRMPFSRMAEWFEAEGFSEQCARSLAGQWDEGLELLERYGK
jgi:hypothetical protein